MSKTTAEQLIKDIDRRYPNTYTSQDKIDWINDALKEVYKDLAIDEFYSFDTISGEQIYNLPSDCTIDMIKSVQMSINPSSYMPRTFKNLEIAIDKDTMIVPSFYKGVDENQIGIYPVPDEAYRINLYYKKMPRFVVKLDDFIDINDRYTNLIKYNVLITICTSGHNPDSEMANQYTLMYNSLVQEVNQAKYEDVPKYHIIKNAMPPRLRRRRGRL